MSKKSSPKTFQRLVTLALGIAFVGSTGFALVGSLLNNNSTPTASNAPEVSIDEQLAANARGYEKVLAREPENVAALRGLVDARLQMRDLQGAIAPMEKLVELNPEEESLQALLEEIKLMAQQESELPQPEQTSEPTQ